MNPSPGMYQEMHSKMAMSFDINTSLLMIRNCVILIFHVFFVYTIATAVGADSIAQRSNG